jgi:ribosomal protein L11
MEKEIKKEFSMSLRMGVIESGPPLGTVLNTAQVTNSAKLVKELNEYTKDLPPYFLLQVKIIVYLDNTYSFIVSEPNVSLMLRLVTFKKEIFLKTSGGLKGKFVDAVLLKDIYLISFFKFNNCLESSIKSVVGTVNSLNILIVKNK